MKQNVKVGIADQTGGMVDGILYVRRSRITLWDGDGGPEPNRSRTRGAARLLCDGVPLAWADVSTGRVHVCVMPLSSAMNELARCAPRELLVSGATLARRLRSYSAFCDHCDGSVAEVTGV